MSESNSTEAAEFTGEQQRSWEKLVASLRRVIEHAVGLDASVEVLEGLNSQCEALEAGLAAISGAKPVPRFRLPIDMEQPGNFLPYSPITGVLNPVAPPVRLTVEDGHLFGRVTLGSAYEGGVGFAHGGVVALIWDQMLALSNVIAKASGVTGSLNITYKAVTPVHQELVFEAWHESTDGRKIRARGRCMCGDVLVSEAEGLFIRIDSSPGKREGFSPHTQREGTVAQRRGPEGQ